MLNKKSIFLVSLVLLLVVVGYINHLLIEMNTEKANADYQIYENNLADINNLDINTILEASTDVDNNQDIIVVDSKDEEISELSEQTNSLIENIITKEENRKRINYYVEYRLSRDKLRASLMENLQFIIDNQNSTEGMKNEAQAKIITLVDVAHKELYIEELVKSKGIDDALVFLNNDKARVVVEINELNEQLVAKILDIVMEQTELKAINIKIMKRF